MSGRDCRSRWPDTGDKGTSGGGEGVSRMNRTSRFGKRGEKWNPGELCAEKEAGVLTNEAGVLKVDEDADVELEARVLAEEAGDNCTADKTDADDGVSAETAVEVDARAEVLE